ncbi:hypothetical protein B0I08_102432 [Glaciihabitans tibetensis]|uniref:Uncharacterized protein n=1 Tax=Glaciihabitans tibetensis TaxID=1266600 RepID=A0A2T0VHV5_9MICO|nr:hypothetical protein [Glaciihabitans tibetensis]PRY69755.1 hypothetical protein B0I08_102432 [Glaciihabitans tibetensis]
MPDLNLFYLLDNYLWAGAALAIGVCIVLAIVSARINLPLVGALSATPVALGLLASALGLQLWPPHPMVGSILAVELFVLGVVAGGPLTLYVVGRAESHSVRAGLHGGIVPAGDGGPARGARVSFGEGGEGDGGERDIRHDQPEDNYAGGREVLRGGSTIGYLERIAVLGCLAVGRVEGIAVIVAIKGLGRFNELDSPEARERFIIGTLVSLIWACATGALLLITVQSNVPF